jgi:hypothetical protein
MILGQRLVLHSCMDCESQTTSRDAYASALNPVSCSRALGGGRIVMAMRDELDEAAAHHIMLLMQPAE